MDRKQALQIWYDVVLGNVRGDGPDLTARQLSILMTIYMRSAPHTVRGLSEHLQIGKPAVTRSLDALSKLGLLKRVKDPSDGRNVFIQRTVRGSVFLSELGDIIMDATGRAEEMAACEAA